MAKTLYLCYFGLREPLVQTQVLPYLREIVKGGVKVSLLTFEKEPKVNWSKDEIAEMNQKLSLEGIDWSFLTYHQRPSLPATFFDVICGAFFAWRKVRREKIDVLHTRAHIPLSMALPIKLLTNCKVIFDIRGLMAEEYIDAGVWKENSFPVRIVKWIERKGLEKADQIVVLTNRMKNYLVENKLRDVASIEVVPCCVDFSRMNVSQTEKKQRFELIYAGSVTGLYMLKEMGEFFLALKEVKKDAFFRVLTASAPENVHRVFDELKIDRNDYAVEKVLPKDVLSITKKAHLAISFRTPTFSQIAASPTKIPEYLAVGLPVVSNDKIGDMDSLIEQSKVGIVIKEFDRSALDKAVSNILQLMEDKDLSLRCEKTAKENFDVKITGKENYLNVYRKIAKTLND